MSWGQAFGAFGQGLSSGYNTMEGVQQRKAGAAPNETPDYQSGIERLAQRIGIGREEPAKDDAVSEIEDVTAESNAKTWEMIRAQADSNYTPPAQQQQQQSSGGMQIDQNMINQFMNNGMNNGMSGGMNGGFGSLSIGGSGGLGGSGLMGSSGGAIPASTNGGASFGLGGKLVGGTGQVGGSTFATGSGAASAGSSAGSGLASAGPWALLAAAIIGNETHARKKGRRNENKGKHALDLVTGKVLEQDAEYYGDKVGGPLGKSMKFGGQMGNPEGVFNAVKKIFK